MQRSISVGILVVTFVNMFPVKKLLTDDKKNVYITIITELIVT